MKMREQLGGTPLVFSFTLRRLFRSRANLVSLVLSLLMVLASMPLMTWAGGSDVAGEERDHAALSAVAVDNRSDLSPDFSALAREEYWTGVDFAAPADSAEALVRLDGTLDQGYTVTVTGSAGEEDLSMLEWDVVWLVELARIAKSGVTDAQLDILWGDYNVVLPGSEALMPDEDFFDEEIIVDGGDFMDGFWVQYGYAIVVMMLCLLSASYVIRAVVEEKDSKLVELLLLSVRPLALLTGKILAAMVYVLAYLVVLAAGWAGSLAITGAIFGRESIGGVLDVLAGVLPMLQKSGSVGLALVLVVSLLLGYLTMGIIGGLSGACCSSVDEMNAASGSVTMITMVGYLGACIVSAIPGKGLAVFSALCPILSMFCAPVQYARGGIEWWILLISWLLQLALVAALAWLAARVYAELIIHRGSRVKWKELLAMAKRKEAAR